MALAGPDPEPTHDEFIADLYPKVQESLKFPADEHFINDKSTDDEPGKLNVEAEVVSMLTIPIYQASSSVPPLSTPVIVLLPPKPASSTTQAPIFTATTTTTTTTPLPPPLQQQSTTEAELVERVAALEKKLLDLEQTNKNLDNTTQNLGSRVYTLKLRDLPHKINEAIRENVKEAVQIALQAPLRECFRDLSEEDMKEMLHQRMFKSGTYKSLPEHIALYEALEASMARTQRDKFLAEKDKLRKRRRDDQDPYFPPPDSDTSRRRRHDTGASGSSQPQAPQLSAWKKSDTHDASTSSSKQQSGPHTEQPVEDIPIPDSVNISDSEDTNSAHLHKSKQRPEWLRPIPDDERPATPEPAWVIPTSHIPDAENNWAKGLASTYQAPAENSLLEKTGDMRTFMHWYCQKMGKPSLLKQIWKVKRMKSLNLSTRTSFSFSFKWKNVTGCSLIKLTGPILKVINKSSEQALLISKMKAAHYLDFGLELLVPEHMWINEDCKKDFKSLYPSNFEDLNLLLLQGHLNHLSGSDRRMLSTAVNLWTRNLVIRQRVKDFQLGIKSYQKQLNLTKPGWDAKGFEYKHDYTIIDSPRTVAFPIGNKERKIMRFNEIYKFNDGTLTNIMEALDYRAKKYKVNLLNPDSRPEGSSGIWNALLVDGFAILTTYFFTERNDLFIPLTRSVLRDSKVHKKMEMEIPRSNGVYFIPSCSY
ncbi:hypothetical protein Tco_0550844 [Tanacetum coccineum]